jgi:hypothetical protein
MIRPGAVVLALMMTAGLWGTGSCEDNPSTAEIPKEFQGLPLVFHDEFDGGGERWDPTDPKAWKIIEQNGNRVYSLFASSSYKPPVRSPLGISWIKDLDMTDFVLEVRLRQTGQEYAHRDLCIFFGRQDASHFYYAHIATKSDANANTIHLVNGAPRVSISKERTGGTDWGSGWHRVRVVRKTDSGLIQVFFDDMEKPIMAAEDKTFLYGGIGLGSFDDTGDFDDIRVWGKKK